MMNANNVLKNILGKRMIAKDSKSKNKEKEVTVTWEQESYPDEEGDLPMHVKHSKTFESKAEANKWINQMDNSAKGINKYFEVISVK